MLAHDAGWERKRGGVRLPVGPFLTARTSCTPSGRRYLTQCQFRRLDERRTEGERAQTFGEGLLLMRAPPGCPPEKGVVPSSLLAWHLALSAEMKGKPANRCLRNPSSRLAGSFFVPAAVRSAASCLKCRGLTLALTMGRCTFLDPEECKICRQRHLKPRGRIQQSDQGTGPCCSVLRTGSRFQET